MGRRRRHNLLDDVCLVLVVELDGEQGFERQSLAAFKMMTGGLERLDVGRHCGKRVGTPLAQCRPQRPHRTDGVGRPLRQSLIDELFEPVHIDPLGIDQQLRGPGREQVSSDQSPEIAQVPRDGRGPGAGSIRPELGLDPPDRDRLTDAADQQAQDCLLLGPTELGRVGCSPNLGGPEDSDVHSSETTVGGLQLPGPGQVRSGQVTGVLGHLGGAGRGRRRYPRGNDPRV